MPKRYTVRITSRAQKEFKKLDHSIQNRITVAIRSLSTSPRPPGTKKLKGGEDLWRIRVGDYRVVYQIRDLELFVLVVRVRHRSEAYR